MSFPATVGQNRARQSIQESGGEKLATLTTFIDEINGAGKDSRSAGKSSRRRA